MLRCAVLRTTYKRGCRHEGQPKVLYLDILQRILPQNMGHYCFRDVFWNTPPPYCNTIKMRVEGGRGDGDGGRGAGGGTGNGKRMVCSPVDRRLFHLQQILAFSPKAYDMTCAYECWKSITPKTYLAPTYSCSAIQHAIPGERETERGCHFSQKDKNKTKS